jgi:creatinine amidohydrolase
MNRLIITAFFVGVCVTAAPAAGIEFEMMTWPELKNAMHQEGQTTVLVYNGGTEQRGPQNVAGGHTLMGRATVKVVAEKLGNAIAAPVMPYSVNNAD